MTGRQAVLVRAVDAMTRAMGGATVKLHVPAALSGTARELGMEPALMQELELSPVLIKAAQTANQGAAIQVLISSSVLERIASGSDGATFLRGVRQIVYGEAVFVVADVATERFAGVEYLYRVTAVSR
jgi:hypothetical protein